MDNEIYIYSLNHPKTKKPIYVGQSKNPEKRYQEHIKFAKSDIYDEMRRIKEETGTFPEMEIIEAVKNTNKYIAEKHWMKKLIKSGEIITNRTVRRVKLPTRTEIMNKQINIDVEFRIYMNKRDKVLTEYYKDKKEGKHIMDLETNYCGIYLHVEDDNHWLVTADGDDQYFGKTCPSLVDIENFRNEVTKY